MSDAFKLAPSALHAATLSEVNYQERVTLSPGMLLERNTAGDVASDNGSGRSRA